MPFRDDPDDDAGYVPPLHPDDRLWRHPSELGAARRAEAAGGSGAAGDGPTGRTLDAADAGGGAARVWTVAAASLLLGVAATLAVLSATGTFDGAPVDVVVEKVEVDLPLTGDGGTVVADQVGPALVRVDATRPDGVTTATGVVFRSDGHLLTTADAVAGATAVAVTLADGSVLPARLVGVDASIDLAVLDVDRDDLAVAVLGRVADLEAGTQAVAVSRTGDAAGPEVASGHVSALGLRVDTVDGETLHDMIQAALEMVPSTSGAVLCTPEGAVLGLLTGREVAAAPRFTPTSATEADPTTPTTAPAPVMPTLYATPIDYAVQVADEIVATGSVRHTWLGVLGDDLDPATAATLGRSGATLTRVLDGGPADRAGLQVGDVVLALDGVQVTSMSSLVVALRDHHPDDVVSVSFVRDGTQRVALATLTERS